MEKNIDLYVHQNDISKYDHKKYTRTFTKSKEDIEYDMKVLKGYVDRFENTSSTVEECIFKTDNEDYFDVLELYSELYEDENHFVHFDSPGDYSFFFDVKYLFKDEVDEENLKIEITSRRNDILLSTGRISKSMCENITVYSVESGCLMGSYSLSFMSSIKPYAIFYRAFRLSKSKEDCIEECYMYSNHITSCMFSEYYSIYDDYGKSDLKDGDILLGHVISPTNTVYDIMIRRSEIDIKHSINNYDIICFDCQLHDLLNQKYSFNPLNKLIVLNEKNLICSYVYDNGLYIDEIYFIKKQMKLEQLHLCSDLTMLIGKYF